MTSSTGRAPGRDEPWLARLLTPRSASLAHAPAPAPVAPEAVPYVGGEGRIGVLLCHGFTGSPASLRPWAERLAAAGFRVRVPRLPGHGTDWREMNRTTWPDWYAGLVAEFAELSGECERVVVGGLSMGGALALHLAAQLGDQVAGLALVNPSVTSADPRMAIVPALSRFVGSLPAIGDDIAKPGVSEHAYPRTPLRALTSMTKLWRVVCADLPGIRQPLLLFLSEVDHVVDPTSAAVIRARIGSTDLTRRTLTRSHHVATLDYDAELIFAESEAFFARVGQPQGVGS